MFARVSRFEGRSPESIDDGVRNAREYILPAFRDLPGFRGIVVLVDRKTGNWTAMTLWSTEDAMHRSAEPADRLRRQALTTGETMTAVEEYEIAVLEVEAGTTIGVETE